MLVSSFFSKSKPVNYVFVIGYMLLFYTLAHIQRIEVWEVPVLVSFGGGAILYVFSMLLLDFIARRNEISSNTSYLILCYAVCSALAMADLVFLVILIINILILLTMRSVITLHSQRNLQKKILDASLWVSIAFLTNSVYILLMIPVIIAVSVYASGNYRNWIIPFLGFLSVLIIYTALYMFIWDGSFSINSWFVDLNFNFKSFPKIDTTYPLVASILFILFFGLKYAFVFKRITTKRKPIAILIFSWLGTVILLSIISYQTDTPSILFIAAPLAIMSAFTFETFTKDLVREIALWIFILLPFFQFLS